MTRNKTILATAVVVIIGVLYCYVYRDAFQKPVIQIFHIYGRRAMAMRNRPGNRGDSSASPVTFGMGHEYRLTSVRVVALDEYKTNRYALSLWELVSDSNSVPTRAFDYGKPIRGMHAAVTNARPDPLMSNVTYRLFVEAGKKLKGEHDFILGEENRPPQQ
jgi:hypothetical protein